MILWTSSLNILQCLTWLPDILALTPGAQESRLHTHSQRLFFRSRRETKLRHVHSIIIDQLDEIVKINLFELQIAAFKRCIRCSVLILRSWHGPNLAKTKIFDLCSSLRNRLSEARYGRGIKWSIQRVVYGHSLEYDRMRGVYINGCFDFHLDVSDVRGSTSLYLRSLPVSFWSVTPLSIEELSTVGISGSRSVIM